MVSKVDSVGQVIKDNLGEKTLKKIECRLHERYDMSINMALHEPKKFETVLREFFGDGAVGLEKRIFENLQR
jgi:hypothetical protein